MDLVMMKLLVLSLALQCTPKPKAPLPVEGGHRCARSQVERLIQFMHSVQCQRFPFLDFPQRLQLFPIDSAPKVLSSLAVFHRVIHGNVAAAAFAKHLDAVQHQMVLVLGRHIHGAHRQHAHCPAEHRPRILLPVRHLLDANQLHLLHRNQLGLALALCLCLRLPFPKVVLVRSKQLIPKQSRKSGPVHPQQTSTQRVNAQNDTKQRDCAVQRAYTDDQLLTIIVDGVIVFGFPFSRDFEENLTDHRRTK